MNTKKFVSSMGVLAPSFLAIALVGCSASDNGPAGATGTGGSTGSGGSGTGTGGSSGNSTAAALTFDTGGFVAMTPLGVLGPFYSYGDGSGENKCVTAGAHAPAECSTVTATFDATGQKVCATGVAAKVLGTPADYSNMFGAGVALDLNNRGGDAGAKGTYNAAMHGVTGVGFTLTSDSTWSGAGEFRVEFPAVGQDGVVGQARYVVVPLGTSAVEAKFANATVVFDTTGLYPGGPDATTLYSFQWHISTNISATTPYNFCLTNIHLLTN